MRRATLLATGLLALVACGSESTSTPGSPPPSDAAPPPGQTEPPATDSADPAPTETTTPPDSGDTTEPTTTEPDGSETTMPDDGDGTLTPTQQELANDAIADLASRIDVGVDTIGVRSVAEVTWRDGAIGCPDPDFQYSQALVPGILVVLDHDGFAYHYHQGGDRDLFYCPNPAAPVDT